MPEPHRLCYVRENWAFFSRKPPEAQGGDGWLRVPYEHNSSEPYGDEPGEVVKLAWEAPGAETPCSQHLNSPYSVDAINRGAVAWISCPSSNVYIPAGVTVPEFERLIRAAGGAVYVRQQTPEEASLALDWKRVTLALLDCFFTNEGTIFQDEWEDYGILPAWRASILEEWRSGEETREEG